MVSGEITNKTLSEPILLTVVVFGEAGFEAEAGVTILHFCAGLLGITKQVVARLGSCLSKNNHFYREVFHINLIN